MTRPDPLRVLAVSDEVPPVPAAELVAANAPDAVLTLGDLPAPWLLGLRGLDLPVLGVAGNHDAEGDLEAAGVTELHLRSAEVGGWRLSGFGGCVRYSPGPHQYTQEEAAALVRGLPACHVLVCHTPPAGVNDEPGDPAHEGFTALRSFVAEHPPRHLLHGHTTPDPRTRTAKLGPTAVHWVRGARVIILA